MIVVPQGPRCSKCGECVSLAVQFWACSGEHGFNYPDNRGSKRSVRLCVECLDDLSNEMCEAAANVIRCGVPVKKKAKKKGSSR